MVNDLVIILDFSTFFAIKNISFFSLLQAGFIRHTVNKITFSEQCYYVFGDLCGSKFFILFSFIF